MADLALLEDVANGRIRSERIFRQQEDLLANEDEWLMSRFQLPRAVLLDLCGLLGPVLQRSTRRNHAVPVLLQVLTTLGFLATGTFQRELADSDFPLHFEDCIAEDTAAAGGLRAVCRGDAGPRQLLSCSIGTTGPAGTPSD
ncbi:unnamed protein product [Leuciscus chuanchicus]